MQARTNEATMEDHEEIAERLEVEVEACRRKGESYMCHHYERETCLIHFKCCPEDAWYACHKCHNETLGLVENLDEKGRENKEPSSDHSDDNYTQATNIPGEMEDSSNHAETSSEHEDPHRNDASTGGQSTGETSYWPSDAAEGSNEESSRMNHTGLQDDPPSTSENVETNKAVTGEIPDKPGNNEEGCSKENSSMDQKGPHDEPLASEKIERKVDGTSDEPSSDEEGRREENVSQLPVGATSPSPKENKTKHSVATALDGTRLKCAKCKNIQEEFSQYCVRCANFSFATYFCGECKLLIEKKVDPYHCVDCGICRANKADHFHCDVCNICMSLSLKENHKCFADRGHDPCAICFEEVFSGAVIFPCHHMIHKDCAEKLVLSGSNLCPMCRNVILQEDEEAVTIEETAQQTVTASFYFRIIQEKLCGAANSLYKRCERCFKAGIARSSERETEMANVLTPLTPHL